MLTKIGPDIWIAEGSRVTGAAGFEFPTRMVVIGLPDGLLIWSPVALTEVLRSEVLALGPVRQLIAPNSLHHSFVGDWQAAFPEARLLAAPGVDRLRPDLRVHAVLSDLPDQAWSGRLESCVVPGNRITTEVVFFHHPSRTVIFTDLLQQIPLDFYSGWRRIIARLDLMSGTSPHVPRKFRLGFTRRLEARKAILRILAWPSEQLVMAHGPAVSGNTRSALRQAFTWLVGPDSSHQ